LSRIVLVAAICVAIAVGIGAAIFIMHGGYHLHIGTPPSTPGSKNMKTLIEDAVKRRVAIALYGAMLNAVFRGGFEHAEAAALAMGTALSTNLATMFSTAGLEVYQPIHHSYNITQSSYGYEVVYRAQSGGSSCMPIPVRRGRSLLVFSLELKPVNSSAVETLFHYSKGLLKMSRRTIEVFKGSAIEMASFSRTSFAKFNATRSYVVEIERDIPMKVVIGVNGRPLIETIVDQKSGALILRSGENTYEVKGALNAFQDALKGVVVELHPLGKESISGIQVPSYRFTATIHFSTSIEGVGLSVYEVIHGIAYSINGELIAIANTTIDHVKVTASAGSFEKCFEAANLSYGTEISSIQILS